jgi:hypothetical protein
VPGGGGYSFVGGTPAMDLTIVRAGDPASLLIDTAAALEYVEHAISGARTMPWQGFFWRMETVDEPAGGVDIAQHMVNSGADGRLSYSGTVDQIYHFFGGSSTAGIAYALGTWVWIEQIFDVSTATAGIYTRVNAIDLTPVTLAHASTTAIGARLGVGGSVATAKYRISRAKWGYAASVADWLGEPAGGPGAVDRLQPLRSGLRW